MGGKRSSKTVSSERAAVLPEATISTYTTLSYRPFLPSALPLSPLRLVVSYRVPDTAVPTYEQRLFGASCDCLTHLKLGDRVVQLEPQHVVRLALVHGHEMKPLVPLGVLSHDHGVLGHDLLPGGGKLRDAGRKVLAEDVVHAPLLVMLVVGDAAELGGLREPVGEDDILGLLLVQLNTLDDGLVLGDGELPLEDPSKLGEPAVLGGGLFELAVLGVEVLFGLGTAFGLDNELALRALEHVLRDAELGVAIGAKGSQGFEVLPLFPGVVGRGLGLSQCVIALLSGVLKFLSYGNVFSRGGVEAAGESVDLSLNENARRAARVWRSCVYLSIYYYNVF